MSKLRLFSEERVHTSSRSFAMMFICEERTLRMNTAYHMMFICEECICASSKN
ncbi:hypothetical protein WN55_08866 [Dufourea novaeangliae]|uniref:Uncharacterized protein n=1 Tax=Dufourea novaeangliae TaxID=178035 RepID=A0A154P010_DUFNO|nr:hypothetical protein WN55_08866 [Dufourea novaeangliae]